MRDVSWNTLATFAKRETLTLLLLAGPFAALPFVWDAAPSRLPIHWDAGGAPDRYGSKAVGLLLLPLLSVGVYGLLLALPKIDPKRRVAAWDQKPLPALRLLTVLLLTAFHAVTLAAALGHAAPGRLIPLIVLLLFLGMGNYLSALPPNYFVGIRTPWTLEDPAIWRRTHRLAGWLWTSTSAALLVAWLLTKGARFEPVFTAGLLVMALGPVAYSFYLWATRPTDAP